MNVLEKSKLSPQRRNETEVDREMERLSARMLSGSAQREDIVKFERLKSWRRDNLFQVMPKAERRKLFG